MRQLKMDDCSQRYLPAKVILEGMCTICDQKAGLVSHHLYNYALDVVLQRRRITQVR